MAEPGKFLDKVVPDGTPLDPNQFVVLWDTTFEALAFIVILSFIIERLLALVFESKEFCDFRKRRWLDGQSSFKELTAFILSAIVCLVYQVDLLAILMSHAHTSVFGELLTAGLVAGGSKASIKLFREVLGFKSNAYKEYEDFKNKQGGNIKPPQSGS